MEGRERYIFAAICVDEHGTSLLGAVICFCFDLLPISRFVNIFNHELHIRGRLRSESIYHGDASLEVFVPRERSCKSKEAF